MDGLIILAGSGALLGLVSHLGYFLHGEHQIASPRILGTGILTACAYIVVLSIWGGMSKLQSTWLVAFFTSAYLVAIWTSMLIYRVFFHRLKSFPGPFPAKLSKIWYVYKIAPGLTHFRQLDKFHHQYGDFVRTGSYSNPLVTNLICVGPNEVSIADPRAVEIVHGPKSKCSKSEWYDLTLPLTTLHQMRNRAMHDRRRRGGWDKAFNAKSLRGYESRVTSYADVLVEQISKAKTKPINVSKMFIFYTFDVMGELAFGRSFDALRSGKSHYIMEIMHNSSLVVGALGPNPWIMRLLTIIPPMINPIQKFLDYSESCVTERKKMKVPEPDIMSYLLDGEPFFADPRQEKLLLTGDSRLIIVAGSDTTATTLAFAFHHLAKDPSQQQKIRDELKQLTDINDQDALRNLPYLDGVINETLRLHPAVPGGVYRTTPPEGIMVGETYIPGNVIVLTPQYTIQRCKEAAVDVFRTNFDSFSGV